MKRSDTFFCGVTVLFFAYGLFFFVSQYGKSWELGPNKMPQVALDESGDHYADGRPIDPLTLKLIRTGTHGELIVTLLTFSVVCLVGTIYLNHDSSKLRAQTAIINQKIRMLRQQDVEVAD